MNITAAVLEAPNAPFVFRELRLAKPAPDELIVRITSSGICHTDIGVQNHHPLPAVLGHEGEGVVDQCGAAVTEFQVGDRVALSFGSCGCCAQCRVDTPAHCAQMAAFNFTGLSPTGNRTLSAGVHGSFFYQSSFASHALVNSRNAIKVPHDLPHHLLGPLGCGVQTGVGAVINTLAVERGSSIVCIGAGAVGLSAIMGAKIAGCRVIVAVDFSASRLKLATSLGATHVFQASDNTLADVLALTGGGADYCIDSAGTESTFHDALNCVRVGGHVGLAAVPNWQEGFHFMPGPLAMGRTVTGIVEGSSDPKRFIPQLCQWIVDGQLPVERLITTYPYSRINQAVDDLRYARVIKPVVVMSADG